MGAERVTVGVIGKPLGLKGDLFVRPDPDLDHDFPPGQRYPGPAGELEVASSRIHSGRQVVRFVGIDDVDAAAALRGVELTVERASLPLEPDAFWSADLLGRPVVDDQGGLVGVVEEVRDGAAHDYLVVARPDGGEVLIPAVAELVDVTEDGIVIRPIPGLLDDAEAW